jgi:hypothetical protein
VPAGSYEFGVLTGVAQLLEGDLGQSVAGTDDPPAYRHLFAGMAGVDPGVVPPAPVTGRRGQGEPPAGMKDE